jgi:predicted metalloprotease with PDZ domain
VHGTSELPLKDLLQRHGVAVLEEPAQLAQALGLRVQETGGIQIKTVLRGGAAERAGFAAGDEWLGLETPVTGKARKSAQPPHLGWRLGKLDELPFYGGSNKKITALVARDKRLLRLELTMPPDATTWRLLAKDAALVKKWLVSAA